jgi:hypothetical protein
MMQLFLIKEWCNPGSVIQQLFYWEYAQKKELTF